MSERKKRNIIIGALCTVLLLMVVGYAAFNSVLKIKGTSNINSNWDIKITNITSEVLHGSATNAKDPEGIGTLEASFETNLVSPGDSMKYTITVANQGNINAKLDKITISEPDNEYVTFETTGLTEGESLNAGSTTDLIVTVTFKDVTINKMDPSRSNLTVTLDYSQADSSSDTPTPSGPYAAEILAEKVVTTGDGLYIDEYESDIATYSNETTGNIRYVYKGANPDNYITFNNETWRILAVESDGTLKIMRNGSITNHSYGSSNNWENSSIKSYINDENKAYTSYYDTLSSEAKKQIQMHTWGIGPVTWGNTDLAAQIQSENSTTWTGKLGLMSASDYLRANSNPSSCENIKLNNTNKKICKTTNYIASLVTTSTPYIWTISPHATNSQFVISIFLNDDSGHINNDSDVFIGNCKSNETAALGGYRYNVYVIPALYLKSDITLSGSGTSDDPYTIN